MKKFFQRILYTITLFILVPVVLTLLIQGTDHSALDPSELIPTTEQGDLTFDEDILPGIIANEISMDTHSEAIKAQAVIARTNCLRAIENGEELPEGLTKGEMIRLWGQENFTEYYSRLESSVESTKGVVMVQDGAYIHADFHKCSAGYTRDAAEVYGNDTYPYLKKQDCRMDIPSPDFLKVQFYTPEEFIKAGGELFSQEVRNAAKEKTAAEICALLSINKKDSSGYVTEIAIEGVAHSGEELRLTYGWNSSAFSIKEVDGEIRITTKGYGHGLGVSLHGANQLAEKGYTYKDILKYFYSGIEL